MISIKNVTAEKNNTDKKGKIQYFIDGQYLFVEEFAALNYVKSGFKVYYTENTFWWHIMSLLFWNIIFARIDNAFSQYGTQDMPNDFFTPDFYRNREDLILNRLKELQNSDLIEKIRKSYNQNKNKPCRPIEDWDRFSLNELENISSFFNKEVILEICHRLLKNFNNNRSGLPDLIVGNEKEVFFVEVKSENDRLSSQQIEWHKFLIGKLKIKVELFLVNHTDRKIANIQKSYKTPQKNIEISFGHSTSKKREDAIKHIEHQPDFTKEGEGKNTIYKASFNTNDLDNLFKMLDLTSGWKSQKIVIDGETVSSTELRNSLYCFKEKQESVAGSDWCKEGYDNKNNFFGCKQIFFNEFESNNWQDYGYVDTEKGIWIFDKEAIKNKLMSEIERLRFCPLLDKKKIINVIEKLPDYINPKENDNWSFLSNDYYHWIYYQNKWISDFSDKPFPGYSLMTGVAKISKKERKEIIEYSSGSFGYSRKVSSTTSKKSSGCFIATFVYGDYNSNEVIIFRNYRDNTLEKKVLGRLFIKVYYLVSPKIVKVLKYIPKSKSVLKTILDEVANNLENK